MTEQRIIQITITVVSFIALLLHIFLPQFNIDSYIILLLAIAAIPWLAPLFKSVELPGGLKLEFQSLEKVTEKLKESGLITASEVEKTHHHKYSFLNVVDIDSNLALTGLRMEIETKLRDLALAKSIKADNKSIRFILHQLESAGVLKKTERSAILDLLPILNKAAHGVTIDKETHQWVIEFGPVILDNIQAKITGHGLPELIERFKNRDGALGTELGFELSISLLRSTESFFTRMQNEVDVFNDWLNELHYSTFTIFSANNEIDEQLEYARLEKLKELMIDSTKNYHYQKKKDRLAQQLLAKLEDIEIASVW